MTRTLAKQRHDWTFICSTPPREVFAVSEQMIGTPPYRFEEIDQHSGRIVEVLRRGFVGNWRKKVRHPHWVRITTRQLALGTEVTIASSGDKAALSRALQVVHLLTRGMSDARTVYRDRRIPPGPVTLVASWAGTGYALFAEPSFEAARSGAVIHTATELAAVEHAGSFVRVRLPDATEGWVEADQIVAAPAEATREAQEHTARAGG